MSTYYRHFLKESKNIYSTANPGHLGPTEKLRVQNLPFPEIPSQLEDQPAPPPGMWPWAPVVSGFAFHFWIWTVLALRFPGALGQQQRDWLQNQSRRGTWQSSRSCRAAPCGLPIWPRARLPLPPFSTTSLTSKRWSRSGTNSTTNPCSCLYVCVRFSTYKMKHSKSSETTFEMYHCHDPISATASTHWTDLYLA